MALSHKFSHDLAHIGSNVNSEPVDLPLLSFLMDTSISPINFTIAGDEGKVVNIVIDEEEVIILTMTGENQIVSYTSDESRPYPISVTGDIDYITDISIANQLNCKNIVVYKLTRLENLVCNNAALTIQVVDALLVNLTDVTSIPALFTVGLHGQTPAAPPTLGIYNAFRAARGSMYVDVDPQPYTAKVVISSTTVTAKTVSFTFQGTAGKTINIAWGQTTANSDLVLDGTLQTISYTYATTGNKLVRVTGDVNHVTRIDASPLNNEKITEFNPKNFSGLIYYTLNGCGMSYDAYLVLDEAFSKEVDFPNLLCVFASPPANGGFVSNFFALKTLRPTVKVNGVVVGTLTVVCGDSLVDRTITIEVSSTATGYVEDVYINWGDGVEGYIAGSLDNIVSVTHVFPVSGTYYVSISTENTTVVRVHDTKVKNIYVNDAFIAVEYDVSGCSIGKHDLLALYSQVVNMCYQQDPIIFSCLNISGQVPEVLFTHAELADFETYLPDATLIANYSD